MASPRSSFDRSIAHVPYPRTWPPVAIPAVITCSQCASVATVALVTDYVHICVHDCGEIWSVPRRGVKQMGEPIHVDVAE